MPEYAEVLAREASLQREVERLRGELARAEATVAAANRERRAFVQHMNHEVRTPLNAILGFIEMLRGEKLTAGQHELVAGLQENGGRLGHLLETMLALSHLESEPPRPARGPFVPAAVIDAALAGVAGFALRRAVRLRTIGREQAEAPVVGDGTWVQWVVGSLLHNAIKFGGAGEVIVGVRVTTHAGGEADIDLAIRDFGPGVAPQRLAELTAGLARPSLAAGLGIGLTLSGRLCALMGAELALENHPQGGTIARLRVPVKAYAAEPTDGAGSGSDAGAGGLARALRILVAEDNPFNQRVIAGALRKLGHGADMVADGRAAIAAVASARYDLVLMDVMMPELDGLAATREICARWAGAERPVVVAMTAQATPEDRDTCLAAGMSDFLTKPLDTRRLAEVLRACPRRSL